MKKQPNLSMKQEKAPQMDNKGTLQANVLKEKMQ